MGNTGVWEKKATGTGPQRENRQATRGPGGAPHYPPGLGEILVEPFFNRVWGETGLPKGLLDSIQTIWVAGNPVFSNLGPFPKQHHVLGVSHYCSKPRPGRVWRPIRDPGPECGAEVQIWSPGLKISKLRLEKTCRKQWPILQTEPYFASHDPKPLWGVCGKD